MKRKSCVDAKVKTPVKKAFIDFKISHVQLLVFNPKQMVRMRVPFDVIIKDAHIQS